MTNFDPIPFKLAAGSEAEARFKKYLKDKTASLRRGLEKLHGMDGIIKWRKAYEAKPQMEKRSVPWEGASNIVVPIVAIHSDTLLARVMAALMKTKPFWTTRLLGDWSDVNETDGLRESIEEFLGYVGLEPGYLNLYPVYHEWLGEAIRLGTAVLKTPWVREFEDQFRGVGNGTEDGWERVTLYEGPKPTKLRFEDFKCPVNRSNIEDMDFKFDVVHLDRYDLEERAHRGVYDKTAVQRVLQMPDRTSSVGQVQAQKEQDAKVATVPGYGFAEWEVDEISCRYRVDPQHFARLIIWYHERSQTVLRSYYHYYPDELYIAARLFYRDDMFHGRGFAELLLPFQEEISEIHNQRRDNMTVANMKIFAVDPDSKLHRGFKIYPSVMLPAKQQQGQKEIETLEFGTPVQGEIDSERLSLELAEKLSGVSPPMHGMGSGTNTKRGIYTAMGTLSLLQEGNTRTDLNVTDIRFAHTKVGRQVCQWYGKFGVPDKLLESFGASDKKIRNALEAIVEGRMALPVYASTASVNKEVEKQSDLMLTNVMNQYHQGITQMLGAINNPMTPEPVKKYVADAIEATRSLMATVLRHFDRDEIDRLAPKPDVNPEGSQPPQGGAGPRPNQLQAIQGGRPALGPGVVPPSVMPGGAGGGGPIQ